ncbi:MAG: CDP-alcohol phosphatidyltransferase family protein [Deltaproteobacteria bacterium]|nr:CDP-alcohol phosphatidyltransferase family protein [Deltaproteobacteria bacterium]
MQAVIFVPDTSAGCRDGAPGGLSLLERQLKQLRALNHGPATLVVPEAVILPPLSDTLVAARCRVPAGDDPFAALAAAPALPARFLFLAADWLLDARVLCAAAATADDTLMRDEDGRVAPVGRLTGATVERLGATLPASVPTTSLDALDAYAPELRGNVPPYLLRVRSAADRRLAWRVLLDHVQKRGLDLPGQYFDSPFENALVRALAATRVTPNQITLATLVLAAVVGVLFLRGSLAFGLVLALVVGVLDGVDGKLARMKLATSRLGELEHVGDFVYENFWYVALALHLFATTGMVGFWRAGMAIVTCDLVDNLLYGAVQARTGRFLDELSPFDRGFRAIAGRRNVYVWILVAGVCVRRPASAFLAVTGWAAITALVHGVRAAVWTWRGAGAAVVTPQVSEIEPVAGTLVSEK